MLFENTYITKDIGIVTDMLINHGRCWVDSSPLSTRHRDKQMVPPQNLLGPCGGPKQLRTRVHITPFARSAPGSLQGSLGGPRELEEPPGAAQTSTEILTETSRLFCRYFCQYFGDPRVPRGDLGSPQEAPESTQGPPRRTIQGPHAAHN